MLRRYNENLTRTTFAKVKPNMISHRSVPTKSNFDEGNKGEKGFKKKPAEE